MRPDMSEVPKGDKVLQNYGVPRPQSKGTDFRPESTDFGLGRFDYWA